MANYAASLKAKIQALYEQKFQKNELRTGRKPISILALQNAPLLVGEAELMRIRESERRAIEVSYISNPTFTTTAARVALHTGPVGDSAVDALSWVTVAKAFSMVDSMNDDNMISEPEALMVQFQKAVDSIMSAIETAGATFLQANNTGVNVNNNQLGTFNGTSDAFEIALANVNNFFWAGRDNMQQNNYSPLYDVILDNYLYSLAANLSNQGDGNATNYGYQFDEFRFGLSNELTVGTNKGVSFWMPQGAFGLLTWIPKSNKIKRGLGEWDYLTTFRDPRYPIDFALSIRKYRSDESANSANVQSYRTQFELSVDYCFKKAPLTTVGETVIHKVSLLAS